MQKSRSGQGDVVGGHTSDKGFVILIKFNDKVVEKPLTDCNPQETAACGLHSQDKRRKRHEESSH